MTHEDYTRKAAQSLVAQEEDTLMGIIDRAAQAGMDFIDVPTFTYKSETINNGSSFTMKITAVPGAPYRRFAIADLKRAAAKKVGV